MRLAQTAFLVLILSVPTLFAQREIVPTVGEPVGDFPKWEERVLHQLTNRARVDPATDLAGCGANCSPTELNLACYAPIAPLAWNLNLNESARFHSAYMAKNSYTTPAHDSICKLFPNIDALYPETCDASFACSCETGTPVTTAAGRVPLFGASYTGEIIAVGQLSPDPGNPYEIFYAWLHEPAPDSLCSFNSLNGHRYLILKNTGPAIGYGYYFQALTNFDHYWTGDFGGAGTAVPKIPSGSHWGTGTNHRRQEPMIEFWANWEDAAAPTEPSVIVDGVSSPLTLSRGTAPRGAWTTTLAGLGSGCHRYYFSFRDSFSQIQTYPTTGSFGIGDNSCADWIATRTAGDPPGTPAGLVATASTSTSVSVSWSASANAAQYQLERSSNNGAYVLIATVPGTTHTDTTVSADTTYLYRVRALNAASTPSSYSNFDYATTVIFLDDPLEPQVTVIKSIHLTQLRTAVNAMRASVGLPAFFFADPNPFGLVVRAVHIQELRTALTPALNALGRPTTFTDSGLTMGTVIRAVHFQELRNVTK